jgi:hypothetical protein
MKMLELFLFYKAKTWRDNIFVVRLKKKGSTLFPIFSGNGIFSLTTGLFGFMLVRIEIFVYDVIYIKNALPIFCKRLKRTTGFDSMANNFHQLSFTWLLIELMKNVGFC